MGKDVWDDAVLAGVVGQAGSLPLPPGAREKLEQGCIVHRFDRGGVVGSGCNHLGTSGTENVADRVGPFRDLHGRCPHSDPDLRRRIVPAVVVRPDQWDRERHGGDVIGSTT